MRLPKFALVGLLALSLFSCQRKLTEQQFCDRFVTSLRAALPEGKLVPWKG